MRRFCGQKFFHQENFRRDLFYSFLWGQFLLRNWLRLKRLLALLSESFPKIRILSASAAVLLPLEFGIFALTILRGYRHGVGSRLGGGWDMQSLLSPDLAFNPLKASDGSSSVPRLQLSSYFHTIIPTKFQFSIIPHIFSTAGVLIVIAVSRQGIHPVTHPLHSCFLLRRSKKFHSALTS